MQKKLKTYVLDEKTYEFDYQKFAVLCSNLSKTMKTGKTSVKFLMFLQDKLDTPTGTIKGWMYGNSGPESLEKIKQIAIIMHVKDFHELLIEREDEVTMLTENKMEVGMDTRAAVANVYGLLVDAIELYRKSIGYTADFYQERNPFEIEDTLQKNIASIRKSRAYITANVVNDLITLYEDVFGSYFQSDDEEYKEWLGDAKDTNYEQEMFIDYKANNFYTILDKVLIQYLP